ncbi:MAG: GIY-YIG nuclease family protein [Bacteroidetes bacterium]|jgi:putative endonuclease|nr:GIY-YIG nuclease family protein [Bacteroidota bacterium]MBT4398026.1 GIY-YIG nuclease family protein [Bacteroidota bacterium]MBT4412370.1 GIY-YIG nuclease family protein [Bacteroidota bacterium]MBT7463581.1 GIY-YIG nuclease family protein [Bacteroidota bacterium]
MDSYYLYILYSEKLDRYYTGSAADPHKRLLRHNEGATKSTKPGRPWKIVYHEEYPSRSEAVKRENYIKRMKSRKFIMSLIAKDTEA